MLHLYYGKDTQDAYAFFFSKIREQNGKSYLICPEQFTHTVEHQAIEAIGGKGLMDTEVLSFSRLGYKILEKAGGNIRTPISGDGRKMLLTKITSEQENNLQLFGRMKKSPGFAEKMDAVISEFKQYATSPDDILRLANDEKTNPFLKRKLADIAVIYEAYSKAISGKYLDTEDYMTFFAEQAKKASFICDGTFYILDFDPFSPSIDNLVTSLITSAKDVHLAITPCDPAGDEELYTLMNSFRMREQKRAKEAGIRWDEAELPKRAGEQPKPKLFLTEFQTVYQEIEATAAQILHLVRDKGYRYRDVAVLINDMDKRGILAERIFRQYGIPVFMDQKKKMTSNPACVYVLALLDASVGGRKCEDVFRLLKTGFSPLRATEIEYLENYAVSYKIRGKRWEKPFAYGLANPLYGEDGMARLEASRETVATLLTAFDSRFGKAGTAAEKTRALYQFLTEEAHLPEKLDALRKSLLETNPEEAEEIRQVWTFIVSVMDQLVALAGDEKLSGEDYRLLFTAGLSTGEIGMIPTTKDQVIIGPARRLATGRLLALFILGASEGVLPGADSEQDLLTRSERRELLESDQNFCRDNGWKRDEENVAIDKAIRKPQEFLWISTAATGAEGERETPSELYTNYKNKYPESVHAVSFPSGQPDKTLLSVDGGISHLTEQILHFAHPDKADSFPLEEKLAWQEAYDWYLENAGKLLAPVKAGLLFEPGNERIQKKKVKALYGDSFSASALEKYSRCPFSYFVEKGLRPSRPQNFETDAASAGTLYHNALLEFSKREPWSLKGDEVEALAKDVLETAVKDHMENILASSEAESYRRQRMEDVFVRTCRALVRQRQSGKVEKTLLEEEFGRRGKNIPAIRVETEQGPAYIEGRIDRVDYLNGGYVKIIDYKSGKDKFSPDDARTGWRLQLMLYLSAALNGSKKVDTDRKPGAVFYFHISDDEIDLADLAAANPALLKTVVEGKLRKSFAMNGVVSNDANVWESIVDGKNPNALPVDEIVSGANWSEKKQSYYGSPLIEPAEFAQLVDEVTEKLKNLCNEIYSGNIPAEPMRRKKESACTYCPYLAICERI